MTTLGAYLRPELYGVGIEVLNLLRQLWIKTDQCWRVFSTGFCFTLFGVGGLILSFVLIPFIQLLSSNKTQSEYRVQRLIQMTFDLFCKIMKITGAIDYSITGAEKLQQDKGCLIIANHPSLIDYVLIASQLKQCDCLVKAAIWENPFIKRIVQAAGYIPNKEPEALFTQCDERFSGGNVLLIFPEGTRTKQGLSTKLQRGAAQIAVRSKVDVRIINITVNPSFLTKEAKWYQVPTTKPFFHVEVKGKIVIESFLRQANSNASAARNLNQHFEEVLFENKKD